MHKSQGNAARLMAVCIIAIFAIPAFGETPVSQPTLVRGASWQAAPDSATDGRDFLFAWADGRGGRSAVYATRVAADGSVLDPEGILVSNPAEGGLAPAVAWTGDSYIVVWQTQGGCRFRKLAADGRIDIGTGTMDGTCPGLRVAALNGTTFVTSFLWHGVLAAAVIESTGEVRRINPVQGGGWFDIACTRSECRWVWESRGSLWVRRLGPHGETLSGDRVLATDAMLPSIAATEDRFLLTWRDRSALGVPSRRIWALELDGDSQFEPFLVAQTTKSAILDARVSRSGRGFMVAWTQERGEAPVDRRSGVRPDDVAGDPGYVPSPETQFEIHARRIGDGESEQLVVARSNVAHHEPPTVVSNGLTHVGAWIERSTRKISARILTDDGAFSRISLTRSATMQAEPHVLHCGDHLLVTWAEELRGSGRYSILARRFHLSGQPLDAAPVVIANATASQHRPVAAFDGSSYLVAWYADSRVHARRMHRDFTLAAEVLSLTESVTGGPPAAAATDRGFAVLHADGQQTVLTRIGADLSIERTVIAESRGNYALGWTGKELVAIWSSHGNRVQAAYMSSAGTRLGPDILVGFGVYAASSLSIACDTARCIAAWGGDWYDGIKTASIAAGQAFLLGDPLPEAPYYRTDYRDRYRPAVMQSAGEFKVVAYGPDGVLYMRTVRDGVISGESMVNQPRVEQEDYAVAATQKGVVAVYSRSVPGLGFGGARRLFLRHMQ
ncbi:MAG: hypothetical protein M3P06_02215 [Acidobacteriota bacterium]|nr:hypothetical protein [Acidobacteriota bacterium]